MASDPPGIGDSRKDPVALQISNEEASVLGETLQTTKAVFLSSLETYRANYELEHGDPKSVIEATSTGHETCHP